MKPAKQAAYAPKFAEAMGRSAATRTSGDGMPTGSTSSGGTAGSTAGGAGALPPSSLPPAGDLFAPAPAPPPAGMGAGRRPPLAEVSDEGLSPDTLQSIACRPHPQLVQL